MSPKSLFIIIIRVIGLLLLVDVLQVIPQVLKTFSFMLSHDLTTASIGVAVFLAILWVYYIVVKYSLFRAEKIVEKFSLEKNFTEEKFELNIHHSSIIKIAVIFIGGYLIIQHFIPMILEIYTFIQNQSQDTNLYYDGLPPSKYMNLVQDVIMVLVGYYMFGNSQSITNFIELKRKK